MYAGVLPPFFFASSPIDKIWPVLLFTATTDGSLIIFPIFHINQRIAVPKSIAISIDNNDDNFLNILNIYLKSFDNCFALINFTALLSLSFNSTESLANVFSETTIL